MFLKNKTKKKTFYRTKWQIYLEYKKNYNIQCKPLNVITLGQDQIDYINRIILITKSSCT